MEDAAHFNPLRGQGVVLFHGLLRLQDSHVDPVFLEILHGGGRHLQKEQERDVDFR